MLNIFILDHSMKMSARYTYDMHLNKEILEICQILCLVRKSKNLTYLTSYVPRRHINNAIVKWTASSYFNYIYVFEYMKILEKEFIYRYGRTQHKTMKDYMELVKHDNKFHIMRLFEKYYLMPRLAYMRPEFIIKKGSLLDVVMSYRVYYFYHKYHVLPRAKWKNRDEPYWHNDEYFKKNQIIKEVTI